MNKIIQIISEILLIPVLFLIALLNRYNKKYDVGIGPEPLINNVYHKMALENNGYKVITFVAKSYYITSKFDIDLSKTHSIDTLIGKLIIFLKLYSVSLKSKILYIYFNGGPIGLYTKLLWRIEPFFLSLARVKTLLLPYGGDVQDLKFMNNLNFKHSTISDYPEHRNRRRKISKKIDLWCAKADHIICGCDWVDTIFYWDTLLLSHFSINTNKINLKNYEISENKILRVLHAPNHKTIKGTKQLVKAVNNINKEKKKIELILVEKKSNNQILDLIESVDLVADQFVIGWYAMFAIEAMSLSKPVLCYLRDDLLNLYQFASIIDSGDIPIINTPLNSIEKKLMFCLNNKKDLKEIGERSRKFVEKFHSLEYIGDIFDKINRDLLNN